MNTEKARLSQRRDQLLKEANAAAKWDANRYNEIIRLEKSIGLMVDDPEPQQTELDLKPARPKRAGKR